MMAVSARGHNEEAWRRLVDKKYLVDMQENSSKIKIFGASLERRGSNRGFGDFLLRAGCVRLVRRRPLPRILYRVRLRGDLAEVSHVGMTQISVKCLCLRSWP
jgi:hypothetical protein